MAARNVWQQLADVATGRGTQGALNDAYNSTGAMGSVPANPTGNPFGSVNVHNISNPFQGPTSIANNQGLPGTHGYQNNQVNAFTQWSGQQQANQAAQQAAQALAQQQSAQSESQRLLRELTARRLMMLRQNVQGQQNRNIGLLRRHLAQRGALDSGSLGAGVTAAGNESSNILAQGTNLAANQEAEGLLALLNRSQDRAFQREQGNTDYERQRALTELRARLEDRNKPSGWESLLSGVGASVGQALPFWLSRLSRGNNK